MTLYLALAAGTAGARTEPVARAGLLVAGGSDHPFWGAVARFAEAVAADLDIELKVSYSAENSYSIKRNGMKLLDGLGESDYFLSGYFRAVTADFLEKAEKAGVNTIVFNTDILQEDRAAVGEPRGKYSHWLAHMVPDERRAGHDLGAVLLEQARARFEAGLLDPLDMIAITGPLGEGSYTGVIPNFKPRIVDDPAEAGPEDSAVSLQRLAGLEKRLGGTRGVNILGYMDAYWLGDYARELTGKALKRAGIDVIWSASDSMALGALEAAEQAGRKPGEDILAGGFDWSEAGLKAVAGDRLAASMGGHFMEAGWALVLIHDHARGKDFSETTGVNIVSRMSAITRDNVAGYLGHFGEGQWDKVDFKKFSRFHNDELANYDFSLDALLEQME